VRRKRAQLAPDVRLPTREIPRLARLYVLYREANGNISEVARRTGLAWQTVRDSLERAGVDFSTRRRELSEAAIREALTESEGIAHDAIERLGVTRTTFYRKLKEFGIRAKDYRPRSTPRQARATNGDERLILMLRDRLGEKQFARLSQASDTSADPAQGLLRALLIEHRGHVSAISRLLHADRVQVRRWCRVHGLSPAEFRPADTIPKSRPVRLQSLRERLETFYARKHNTQPPPGTDADLIRTLFVAYAGNVSELARALEVPRAQLWRWCHMRGLSPDAFRPARAPKNARKAAAAQTKRSRALRDRLDEYFARGPVRSVAANSEYELLRALLAEHGGNISAVSRALDVRRPQVWRWCRRHGLSPDDFRDTNAQRQARNSHEGRLGLRRTPSRRAPSTAAAKGTLSAEELVRIRAELCWLGAPHRTTRATAPRRDPNAALANALRAAREDLFITQLLPVCLWNSQDRLDWTSLESLARERRELDTLGFLLDLTAEFSGDTIFRDRAAALLDARPASPTPFLRTLELPEVSRLPRRSNFEAARRWRFRIHDDDLETFARVFDEFAHPGEVTHTAPEQRRR